MSMKLKVSFLSHWHVTPKEASLMSKTLRSLRRCSTLGMIVLTLSSPGFTWADAASDRYAQLYVQGKYLVNNVGKCSDCHTARGPDGRFMEGQELHGAPLPIGPIRPIPGWSGYAPRIAGLPAGYTEAELAIFLQTGRTPSGTSARPPMPAFRMSARDAEAAALYIHSLK
jgi:hypothetical protein